MTCRSRSGWRPATATRTQRPTSRASSAASRSPARRWRCSAPTRSACPPGGPPAGVRGARAGRPAGRHRQRRHGGRAPRRRGAVPGGGGGPDAMEGRGDRQRRPVDVPGVPAPLLLAQRHHAPLQMHLQVQVLVLLNAVPSVLSSATLLTSVPWPGVSVTDQDSGTANGFIVFFLVLDSFSY